MKLKWEQFQTINYNAETDAKETPISLGLVNVHSN